MFINHIIHICLSSESGKAWIDFNHYDQLYLDQIKKAKKNTQMLSMLVAFQALWNL